MQESSLEKRFKLEIEKHGAKAWKFTSPNKRGVPDRLILIPGGQAVFAELKAPGNPLKPLQRKRAEELRSLGFKVYKIDSVEDIEGFIQEVFK